MRQYEFEIVNKRTKRVEHARATAINETIARAQIVLAYGHQFDVMGLCCNLYPAHYVAGEIDASASRVIDMAWLFKKANEIERVSE